MSNIEYKNYFGIFYIKEKLWLIFKLLLSYFMIVRNKHKLTLHPVLIIIVSGHIFMQSKWEMDVFNRLIYHSTTIFLIELYHHVNEIFLNIFNAKNLVVANL